MSDDRDDSTKGEGRERKRRRSRKMGVSGKGFVVAVHNAILKRRAKEADQDGGIEK